jgi:hypothetical protein
MVYEEIGTLVFEIFMKNLPLGLFILSIILTGNLVDLVLFCSSLEYIRNLRFKLNPISIVFGLLINFISLFLLEIYSINDLNVYLSISTWAMVGISTAVTMFLAWRYRIKGNKWIKDVISMVFFLILGILFLLIAINSLPKLIDFSSFKLCSNNFCKIGDIIQKILYLVVILFLGYASIKLFGESKKTRRYSIKKQ